MYDLWKKKYDGVLTFYGHSVAGNASGFWVPQLKLMFDAGLRSPYVPKFICITHTHADHIQNLFPLIMGDNRRHKLMIFIPPNTKDLFENYLESMSALTHGRLVKYTLREIEYGQRYKICNNWYVETYRVDHLDNSVGYGIIECRSKLKSIYRNLSGNEIRDKRLNGFDIFDKHDIHQLLYTGDTTIRSFELNNEIWSKYANILTECTCVHDTPELAIERAHNCYSNIHELSKRYTSTVFYLCHFSSRITASDVEDLVADNIIMCI